MKEDVSFNIPDKIRVRRPDWRYLLSLLVLILLLITSTAAIASAGTAPGLRLATAASSELGATRSVNITAVNSAPILDSSKEMHLDPILEDDLVQIGNDVATIIASAGSSVITDPDAGDPLGIAVIDVGASNGTWQYFINGGTSWQDFGLVDDTSAVLLDPDARIRFLPKPNYGGKASITLRAWDQSDLNNSGDRVDVSVNGGSTAYSVDTIFAVIQVTSVNDPPLVDLNGRLPNLNYAASFQSQSLPVPITAPDATLSDVDSSSIASLIVTLVDRPDKEHESLIATDPGTGIISIESYRPASGRLRLTGPAPASDYTTVLRGLRYQNTASSMTSGGRRIEFVASDGADNSQKGEHTDMTAVLSNTAPVLDPTTMQFTDVAEDAVDPPGDSISALLASAPMDPIHDVDSGALRGFALIGAENIDGNWQFSVDAGTTWLAVGQVSNSAALLLSEQALIRFVPDQDKSGFTSSITVRAWDQTDGANGISGVDVSVNGGTTAFSTGTNVIPIDVQVLNDPPVITINDGTAPHFIEGQGPIVVAGPTLQIVDVDNNTLQSATISITNKMVNEPDILSATINGSSITYTYNETTGVLSLTGAGSIEEYQAILRTVMFNNLSEDPATSDRSILFTAHDGADPSVGVTATVLVDAVNTPPKLDLNGDSEPGNGNVVYYDENGNGVAGPVMVANNLKLRDIDDVLITGATVTLQNQPDVMAESLTANAAGTTIAITTSPSKAELTFSGDNSMANYEKVLRTVTYDNQTPFANRAVRKIAFTVQDASLGQSTEISRIVVRPQYALLPVFINGSGTGPANEEPNDSCNAAYPISGNINYRFTADDAYDWFTFSLSSPAATRVELTNFSPKDGQLVVGQGGCNPPTRIGHNGDSATSKIIELGMLAAGRYYVLVINDGAKGSNIGYDLRVVTK